MANTDNPDPEPTQPQTSDEWLATAPPAIQSAVRNAMEIDGREKAQIIYQMTANVDEGSRPKLVEALQGKELDELRTLAPLAPPANAPAPEAVASYAGAAAPVGNTQPSDFDKDDLLPLPTINWSKD